MFGQNMKRQHGKGKRPGQGAGRGMGRRGQMRGNSCTPDGRRGCGRTGRGETPQMHGVWSIQAPEHAAPVANRPEPAPETALHAFSPVADSVACPFCDKHCPLSDPGCPKGEAYARRM